ncbi:hypothetical protein BFP97_17880 [Roseivirga sp. 4D4]|uniref:hypothetical protein n=1 Tax=Roseivirga sp. 4D4 TaxID=1889784 RepID=UPI0008529587|nr:hypothetical protein [Roseivirga sp. 4D4]OEK03280.1 hypothetical protein BFP97_17880 [Roseivirga sp. 4D4]
MNRFDDDLAADRNYKIEIKTRDKELLKLKLDYGEQKKIIDQGKPMPVLKPDGVKQIQNTTIDRQKLRENYQQQRKQIQKNSRKTVYKIAEKIGKNHPDYPRWLKKELKKDRMHEVNEKSRENHRDLGISRDRERD